MRSMLSLARNVAGQTSFVAQAGGVVMFAGFVAIGLFGKAHSNEPGTSLPAPRCEIRIRTDDYVIVTISAAPTCEEAAAKVPARVPYDYNKMWAEKFH